MAGWIELRVGLIKQGVSRYGIVNPIFQPSPLQPNYTNQLIFEGISGDETSKQHYLDPHVAYRRACLNAIEYLKKFGYSGAQAYAILGTAPVEGRISGIVDIPNACATGCSCGEGATGKALQTGRSPGGPWMLGH
jgi:formamidase